MDKENKKVNNAENTDGQGKTPLEEISDGFYELTSLYSKPAKTETPLTREEQLKRKDEERRALEMQAIKEDIERRYSLQLETAQSKTSSGKKKQTASKPVEPEIDGREAVKEELARIDDIINGDSSNSETAAESKSDEKPEKKKKAKKAPKKQKEDGKGVIKTVPSSCFT